MHNAGDETLLTKPGILPKMLAPKEEPHAMHKVHDDCTVAINKKGAAVAQTTANNRRAAIM